jgi:sigma-B regulation protein RsbU (phosphoserine phosphatase)
MSQVIENVVRDQLVDRRERLQQAVARSNHTAQLHDLLEQVDSALARLGEGSYGLCEHCHEPIEPDRLLCDPLVRFCLCSLTDRERDALEHDLELAAHVQRALLPPRNLTRDGWQVAYHYEAASLVSGDYCDVIEGPDSSLYFMVGDVSGKGVAASMLMAQLHAMFRSLISVGLCLQEMLQQASRLFRKSILPNQYATLICGHALTDGHLEIANAGHPPPFALTDRVVPIDGADLPLGLFANEEFSVTKLQLQPGQALVMYSDGVSEALDISGMEYGAERIRRVIECNRAKLSGDLLAACRDDLLAFCGEAEPIDDVTLFVLGRNQIAATLA